MVRDIHGIKDGHDMVLSWFYDTVLWFVHGFMIWFFHGFAVAKRSRAFVT